MKEYSGEPKNTNSSVYNLLSFDAEFFFMVLCRCYRYRSMFFLTFLLIKSIFTLHVMIDVTKTFFIYVELFRSDPALCVLFVCLFVLFVCLFVCLFMFCFLMWYWFCGVIISCYYICSILATYVSCGSVKIRDKLSHR